jgi:hypothetical protein
MKQACFESILDWGCLQRLLYFSQAEATHFIKVTRNRDELDVRSHGVSFAGCASRSSYAFVFRLLPSVRSLQPYSSSAIHLLLFVLSTLPYLPPPSLINAYSPLVCFLRCSPCFFRPSSPSPPILQLPRPRRNPSKRLHHVQPPRHLHPHSTLCRSTNLFHLGSPPGGPL